MRVFRAVTDRDERGRRLERRPCHMAGIALESAGAVARRSRAPRWMDLWIL